MFRLAFMDVVCERISANSASEGFGSDFCDGGGTAVGVIYACDGASAAVARHAEDGWSRGGVEEFQEGGEEKL